MRGNPVLALGKACSLFEFPGSTGEDKIEGFQGSGSTGIPGKWA